MWKSGTITVVKNSETIEVVWNDEIKSWENGNIEMNAEWHGNIEMSAEWNGNIEMNAEGHGGSGN